MRKQHVPKNTWKSQVLTKKNLGLREMLAKVVKYRNHKKESIIFTPFKKKNRTMEN